MSIETSGQHLYSIPASHKKTPKIRAIRVICVIRDLRRTRPRRMPHAHSALIPNTTRVFGVDSCDGHSNKKIL